MAVNKRQMVAKLGETAYVKVCKKGTFHFHTGRVCVSEKLGTVGEILFTL